MSDELTDQLDAFLEAIGANKEPSPEMREAARRYRKMFPPPETAEAASARERADAVAWLDQRRRFYLSIGDHTKWQTMNEALHAFERGEHVGAAGEGT
jgi:hypothetical protein